MGNCDQVAAITGGKVFYGNGFETKDVFVKEDRFAAAKGEGANISAEGCIVIPGLVDIHFHGAAGASRRYAPLP